MLAARDQENRVFGGTVAGGKNQGSLNPKTPGPGGKGGSMTPLLKGGRAGGNENVQRTVLGKGKALVTPLQPRTGTRAPLGMKTTNGKALQQQNANATQKTVKTGGVKAMVNQFESTQQAPPSARRATTKSSKLSVHSDAQTVSTTHPYDDAGLEYCPPPVPVRKYESDVFPEGVLSFAAFEPKNRLRGYYGHYFIDRNKTVDEASASQRQAFEKLDMQVQKDLAEFNWAALSDSSQAPKPVPKPATKPATIVRGQPPTIAMRKAAAALSMPPPRSNAMTARPAGTRQPTARPALGAAASSVTSSLISGLPLRKTGHPASALPMRPKSSMPGNTSSAAPTTMLESTSRTTLGYNKGRTALSMVRADSSATVEPATKPAKRFVPSTDIESLDTRSIEIDLASLAPEEKHAGTTDASPAFVSIFDVQAEKTVDDDDDETASDDDFGAHEDDVTLGMGSRSGDFDDLDDDFEMNANFS